MENTIFVIVENIQDPDDTFATTEAICQGFGFFLDENKAEEKVFKLNDNFIAGKLEQNPDYDQTEEDETHFGFIPLCRSKFDR
jgi:hypothetical protein